MKEQFELLLNDEEKLIFNPPTYRSTDPETSAEAAHDAEFHASTGRILTLQALAKGPMTDYELEAITGWQKNSIGKRRLECQRAGLVDVLFVDGEKVKRAAPSGSMCLVWTLTNKGARYLDGMGWISSYVSE